MPRSRPVSNPLSFHAPTGQHYVTRRGHRIYLGADRQLALARYHRLALRLEREALGVGYGQSGSGREVEAELDCTLTAKERANRFIAAQQANWRVPITTKHTYLQWLRRFLADHPRRLAANSTLEQFAAWKPSLRSRGCAPRSINHYLGAVRQDAGRSCLARPSAARSSSGTRMLRVRVLFRYTCTDDPRATVSRRWLT